MDSDPGSDGCPADPEHPVGEEFDLTEDGGVKKTILVAGEGFQYPDAKAEVKVSYKGELLDGTVFDESDMFQFTLGIGEVVKGWDVGVASMKHGESASFILTSEYGYGAAGSPPAIPPNATLKFTINLIGWSSDVDISGRGEPCLYKRALAGGPTHEEWVPQRRFGAKCTYTISNISPPDAAIKEVSNAVGQIGYGDIQSRAVEQALKRLKVGEHARILADAACKYLQVRDPVTLAWIAPPSSAAVSFEVTLHGVTDEPPDHWSLSGIDEMLAHANPLREIGNDHYRAKRVWMARKFYRRAYDYLSGDFQIRDPAHKDTLRAAKETVALNLVAAALALDRFNDVYEHVDSVFAAKTGIQVNADNAKPLPRAHSVSCIKALLRRVKAYLKEGRTIDAAIDVRHAKELLAAYSPAVAQAPLPKDGELDALRREADAVAAVVQAEEEKEERAARRALKGRIGQLLSD